MSNYLIREMKPDEVGILKDMLYEAIFQTDEKNLLPRDVIEQPELSIYINNWGKSDDLCLVVEIDGKIVGAVWTRILAGEIKGFGNIDRETPEFAISLYKEYRNQGIGTDIMKQMIYHLKTRGYKQTSLAVQKENYAVKMYQNIGFKIVSELEDEYLMVYNLS
ncbi:GCN5-related N-acetyltransferase [Alkaliphilus metalliredigens QYMF]|uniref:GCN5-related N-acetyltransferase n=1 Tax=Alkaliphilus metalliredigens (strain QYMF) TaxID=293826 RepID=A6TQ21_ALKMQ|nr:GNAT family N-acetyltransferase [Alkaliphilus metalliredigens]ABR48289.1 GCN5-related N-acetyltransferase [Alkaliphilus metalliredigens QYMF]